jgi:hypothetical protein
MDADDSVNAFASHVGDIVDEVVTSQKMHQTTVRFGVDLWEALEETAERLGISVAQYIREATLARLAYNAGREQAADLGAPLERLLAPEAADGVGAVPASGVDPGAQAPADSAKRLSETYRAESAAVWAQSRLARERARQLRAVARGGRSGD